MPGQSGLCQRRVAADYRQLGFAFEADGRQEDGWLEDGYRPKGWKKAQVMKGELYRRDTEPRPVEKLVLKERIQPEVVAQGQFIHKQPLEPTAARRIYTDYLSPLAPQALFASGVEALPFASEVYLGRGPVTVKPEAYQGSDGFYLVLDMGREEAGALLSWIWRRRKVWRWRWPGASI